MARLRQFLNLTVSGVGGRGRGRIGWRFCCSSRKSLKPQKCIFIELFDKKDKKRADLGASVESDDEDDDDDDDEDEDEDDEDEEDEVRRLWFFKWCDLNHVK